MRRYDYKNHVLELKGSKGTLYTDDKLLFRGDGYIAIKMFIDKSERDPNVVKIFRAQLDMREDCKYKKRRRNDETSKPTKEYFQKEKIDMQIWNRCLVINSTDSLSLNYLFQK